MISSVEARRRMGRLLASDRTQERLSRLPVDRGEFCADVIEAYSAAEDVCRLDQSEALAVCEMAAALGLSLAAEGGEAILAAYQGRAVLMIGFSGLHHLVKRIKNG